MQAPGLQAPGQVQFPGQMPMQQQRPMQPMGTQNARHQPQPWHSEGDRQLREETAQRILQVVTARHPNVSMEKLKFWVQRIENDLYYLAPGKEEYADPKTLENRLTMLAKRGQRSHQLQAQQQQQQQALQQHALQQQMAQANNGLPGMANPAYALPSGALASQVAPMFMTSQGLAAPHMAQFAVQQGAMAGYQGKPGYPVQPLQSMGSQSAMLPQQGMMVPDQNVLGSPGANGYAHPQAGMVRMQQGTAAVMGNGGQMMMMRQRGNEWMPGQHMMGANSTSGNITTDGRMFATSMPPPLTSAPMVGNQHSGQLPNGTASVAMPLGMVPMPQQSTNHLQNVQQIAAQQNAHKNLQQQQQQSMHHQQNLHGPQPALQGPQQGGTPVGQQGSLSGPATGVTQQLAAPHVAGGDSNPTVSAAMPVMTNGANPPAADPSASTPVCMMPVGQSNSMSASAGTPSGAAPAGTSLKQEVKVEGQPEVKQETASNMASQVAVKEETKIEGQSAADGQPHPGQQEQATAPKQEQHAGPGAPAHTVGSGGGSVGQGTPQSNPQTIAMLHSAARTQYRGSMESLSPEQRSYVVKQQRWLVFLRHCSKCTAEGSSCPLYGQNCAVAKQLWEHILKCHSPDCPYPRCSSSRDLLKHHQKCNAENCLICVPVRQAIAKQKQQQQQQVLAQRNMHPTPVARPAGMHPVMLPNMPQSAANGGMMPTPGDQSAQQSVVGGMIPTPAPGGGMPHGMMPVPGGVVSGAPPQGPPNGVPIGMVPMSMMPTPAGMMPTPQHPGMMPTPQAMGPQQNMMMVPNMTMPGMIKQESGSLGMPGMVPSSGNASAMTSMQMVPQPQQQQAYQKQQQMSLVKRGTNSMSSSTQQDNAKRMRVGMGDNRGTSLLETFTADEIRAHLFMLLNPQMPVPQHIPNIWGMRPMLDESTCNACNQQKILFEPPSLYCTSCGQRIKRNQTYYMTSQTMEIQIKAFWCHPCYSEIRTDSFQLDGTEIRKDRLEKKRNDEEVDEPWVACDGCGAWVHQPCGLFNKGENNENVHFHCPWCLLRSLERKERAPISTRPQAMLEARDLPKCDLSEHLEQRLAVALQDERRRRSEVTGIPIDQVPTANDMTVRVVNNVDKVLDIKQRFYEAFRGDGYPDRFKYKQKVIILFQRLDGVDVALYCLYVQEYDQHQRQPNCRTVYLSYLDSVKYFRPEEVHAAGTNVALRTFVYHELLIGYLAYVKSHGFTSFYIWACPPLQGDDYILYCHPSKQKTPRSDRLREWYLSLLRKAKGEGIVAYVSNLWDTYFEGGKDHRYEHPSATHLPYFEGDYWPGEAEHSLGLINENSRKEARGKGSGKARGKGSKGKRYGAEAGTTDEQLMVRLNDVIHNMKDDFIVVHLQEPCSFCREYIVGMRYTHPSPPSRAIKQERTFEGISLDTPGAPGKQSQSLTRFMLCERCYTAEATHMPVPGIRGGLPQGMQLAELIQEPSAPLFETVDPNPQMECEIFDTRQAFLSLCSGNHYQFDSIRRARHSSMMVLYHLHNPAAPAFASNCNTCGVEVEPGQGWRCTKCSDFDQCNNCYNNPARRHPHEMRPTHKKLDETRQRLTEKEKQARREQLRKTLMLVDHAASCQAPFGQCQTLGAVCAKYKRVFVHIMSCQYLTSGGQKPCTLCKRMWTFIRLHSQQCVNPDCRVPRCKDWKASRRRDAARADAQRRQAYLEYRKREQQQYVAGMTQCQGVPGPAQGTMHMVPNPSGMVPVPGYNMQR